MFKTLGRGMERLSMKTARPLKVFGKMDSLWSTRQLQLLPQPSQLPLQLPLPLPLLVRLPLLNGNAVDVTVVSEVKEGVDAAKEVAIEGKEIVMSKLS